MFVRKKIFNNLLEELGLYECVDGNIQENYISGSATQKNIVQIIKRIKLLEEYFELQYTKKEGYIKIKK